jgi:hypothetical protein
MRLEGKVLVQVCFKSATIIHRPQAKFILDQGLLAGQDFVNEEQRA